MDTNKTAGGGVGMQKKWAFYDDDPKEIRAFAKNL